jgi:FAD/FMN-containing dehydrogenase
MNSIEFDTSSNSTMAVASFEPAVLAKDVLAKVLVPYGYAGVVGTCGDVAESGFALGGGFGLQSRFRGMGLDQVVGMRVVLADGSVRDVDEDHNSDLFWALRGAGGGNFGVVTQLRVQLYQALDTQLMTAVNVSYEELPIVLQRLGALSDSQQLPTELFVFVGERAKSKVPVNFAWFSMGPAEHKMLNAITNTFQNVMLDLFDGTTIHKNWTIAPTSWAGTVLYDQKLKKYPLLVEPPWIKPYVQAWTGYLFRDNNTLAVWNDIIKQMSIMMQESPFLQHHTELYGGAISQVASNATAFFYREAVYNVGVLLYVPSYDNPNALAIFQEQSSLITAWWPNVSQYLSGVYNNYPMASLSHLDYARAYWGDNLERLVRIKQKYDPTNVFQFEQSVPMQL